MSVSCNESDGFYARMSRLELKLKASEEERLELEEKFNRLLHTCKSKQTMQLQQLRNCYGQLLEQDRARCERNDTILRTLQRVESRASSLTAKTDRLRLLKSHFEANLDCNRQDRYRSSSVNYPSSRSSVSDIRVQSPTPQPTNCSPQPLESSPLLHSLSTSTFSRRSSLVVPDSEILELSKYKLSGESSRRRLFDDSLKPKVHSCIDILSVDNDNIDCSSVSKTTKVDSNFLSSSLKESFGWQSVQRLPTEIENIGLQKSRETNNSQNTDHLNKISPAKSYYDPPFQYGVSNYSSSNLFPSRGISTKTLTKSNSFNTIPKHNTHTTPDKYSLTRRPSLVSNSSISSRLYNRSHSPLDSTSPHLGYNKSKSPLGVVDDIFKKYLINYDKRYLSDPISESKYGKYLYSSRNYENEKEDTISNPSGFHNRSSVSTENSFQRGKNNGYSRSTIYANKLSDRNKSYGSSESLYSATPSYQSSDLLNYTPRPSYLRSDWKEWNHFRDRYQYLPKGGIGMVQNEINYLDNLDNPNYSEVRNYEPKSFSCGFDEDSAIKDERSTRKNNYHTVLNKKNKLSSLTLNLEKPLTRTQNENEIDEVSTNKPFDYEFKLKDNYLKMPQTPKRVSFGKKFLYDDKSDADISLSPEEETNIIVDHDTSKNHSKKSDHSVLQPNPSGEASQNEEGILSESTLRNEYLNNSDSKSSDINKDIISYSFKVNDGLDSDANNMLHTLPYRTSKNIDNNNFPYNVSEVVNDSDDVVTREDSAPNYEEFKTRTKRRASLYSTDETNDSLDDATKQSTIKERSDLHTSDGLENSDYLIAKEHINKPQKSLTLNLVEYANKNPLYERETDSKDNLKEENIGISASECNTLINQEKDKNMLKNYDEIQSEEDKISPAGNKNTADSGPTTKTVKEQDDRDLEKCNQHDNTLAKELSTIKQSNEMAKEEIAENSQKQTGIIVNEENSEDYKNFSDNTSYQQHSNEMLPNNKPAPIIERENSDSHYNQAQKQHEKQQETINSDTYSDQHLSDYQTPMQDGQYLQEYEQQQEIYEDEFHPQPADYKVNNYKLDDTQVYQNNEYTQDQYGQDYVEKDIDPYSSTQYEGNPTDKEYSTTQFEPGYDNQYSEQYEDNYKAPSQQQHDVQGPYVKKYPKDSQYQYDQQQDLYKQADIPEKFDQQYQNQQVTEQYGDQPNQYDTQVSDQYNEQYQNQEMTDQYGDQQYDHQITEQYDEQHGGQSNQYDTQISNQYGQQYQNLHGQETIEQYDNQYEKQPNQYNTQVPDQYDEQYQNLHGQEATEQYEGQPNQYAPQVPDQYDEQYQNLHGQEATEQYEGQPNQYAPQVPDQYDEQYQRQYDLQEASDQYQGEAVQYEGQESVNYNEAYQMQTDQYQRQDQYDQQYPAQIMEQEDQQYQNQPDLYQQQYAGYEQQTQEQYDEKYLDQRGQYEYEHQQAPEQYSELYEGEPVQYGYDEETNQPIVEEQQSYADGRQYHGNVEQSYSETDREGTYKDENLSYGGSEHTIQELNKSHPTNVSSEDHLLTNQGAVADNISVQPTPAIAPTNSASSFVSGNDFNISSDSAATKTIPDLNRVLESDSESLQTRGPVSQDDSSEFDFSLGKK